MNVVELVQKLNAPHQATGAFPMFEVRGTESHMPRPREYAMDTVESHRWHSLWMYPGSSAWMQSQGIDPTTAAVEVARLHTTWREGADIAHEPGGGVEVASIEFSRTTTLGTMRLVADALGNGRVPDGIQSTIRLNA